MKETFKDSLNEDLLTKEKKLQSINSQKVNLLGMNTAWKKKYTKIHTQEIKV